MKKYIFLFLVIFSTIGLLSLNANTSTEEIYESLEEEVALAFEDIFLCREGIFAKVDGNLVELKTLRGSRGNGFVGVLRAHLGWNCP